MGNTSNDAITSYFADLLTEAPAIQADNAPQPATPAESNDEQPRRSEPKAEKALLRQRDERAGPVYPDTVLETLEQNKKQQLQALLNSQLLVSSPEPLATSEKSAIEPKIVRPVAPPPVVPNPGAQIPAKDDIFALSPKARVVNEYLAWADNGRPLWAQKPFDILLFQVAGLNLAVPLIALGHIHPITDELAPIFGQLDWFMGFQPTPAGAIRTVNTALFVMPERYDPKFVGKAKYVISIDGMDWGLAVEGVHNPSTLQPEDVTWRSQRTKRPWLAGTVKSAMCALLDIPQMGHLLQSHDRNRSGPR